MSRKVVLPDKEKIEEYLATEDDPAVKIQLMILSLIANLSGSLPIYGCPLSALSEKGIVVQHSGVSNDSSMVSGQQFVDTRSAVSSNVFRRLRNTASASSKR